MATNIQLIVHNIGAIMSAVVCTGMALLLLFNKPLNRPKVLLALALFGCVIFFISHLIGVNTADPMASRNILMFNLSILWVSVFNAHFVFSMLGLEKKRRYVVYAVYAISILATVIYVLFPDLYLAPSVPKMYFPNYYVAGSEHSIARLVIFNVIIPTYFLVELIAAYRRAANAIEKNRIKYFFVAAIIGYSVGAIPALLIFNIQVDPSWGIYFGCIFPIPLVYAALKYELADIRVVARKAFGYALAIALVGIAIVLFDFISRFIEQAAPSFPIWIVPLISSVIVVSISAIVWRELREGDLLKYEFITTVTHKFRTPLTHIKWASENLANEKDLSPALREQVDYIQTANVSLVELTNLLMNVSEAESQSYQYQNELGDLTATANETIERIEGQFKAKNVRIVKNMSPGNMAHYDASRIRFIIQTFLENAVHYSSESPVVNIMIVREGKDIRCSVTDNGIGIPKEEIPYLFTKFYRGHRARLTDTEGMGIGLFMAREIVKHHKGRIWAESPGVGMGSTFSFTLPAAE